VIQHAWNFYRGHPDDGDCGRDLRDTDPAIEVAGEWAAPLAGGVDCFADGTARLLSRSRAAG
jgi:hypothetical protein